MGCLLKNAGEGVPSADVGSDRSSLVNYARSAHIKQTDQLLWVLPTKRRRTEVAALFKTAALMPRAL